jgi:hypothetical protein
VDGHRSCPKTPGSCFADYGQLCLSHVLHRPRDGADVARAAGANQDNADVFQHPSALPKRAKFIVENNFPIFRIKIGKRVKVDGHNGPAIIHMFSAKKVAQFVDQSQDV